MCFSVDTGNTNFIIQGHFMPMQVEGTSYVTEYANIFLNLPNNFQNSSVSGSLWVISGGQMIILVVTSFCGMLVQLNKQLI